MSWIAPAVGAGASLLGGLLGKKKSAGPTYRPAEINSPVGNVFIDPATGRMRSYGSADFQQTYGGLGDMAQGLLGGGSPQSQFGQSLMTQLMGQIPGLFGEAQAAQSQLPLGALQQYLGGMGGLLGQAQGLAGAGMGQGFGQAGTMFGLGQGLLGSAPQSYDDVAANRLSLLREQAQPFEERAGNQFLNRLFNMGQLGEHTGGLQQTEAFGRGMAQADTARQLESQQFAEQLYGRDLQAALQRQGIGAGLMGSGMQGLLGTMGAGQGLLGLQGDLLGAQYGSQLDMSNLAANRGQQRMANALNLFGFGNAMPQQDLQNIGALLGLQSGMMGDLLAQQQLAHMVATRGGGPTIPGTSSGQVFGAAMQGVGEGILGGVDWSKVFG